MERKKVPRSGFRVPGLKTEVPGNKADETKGQTLNSPLSTLNLVPACMAAAVELEKTRVLAAALEDENRAVTERLETEKRTAVLFTELNETRKSETETLRTAVAAKNETIAAKDAVIASQDKLIAALKAQKPSPWRRIGDVLIGAAVFAVLK